MTKPLSDSLLRLGDEVCFQGVNHGASAVDLNVLLVDSHFEIKSLWPVPGHYNRIPSFSAPRVCFEISEPLGLDGLVVFATLLQADSEPFDLSYLIQGGLPTRGGHAEAGAAEIFEMQELLLRPCWAKRAPNKKLRCAG